MHPEPHDFTLVLRLADDQADPSEYLDSLAAAGCTDALVGCGRPGFLALDFLREAESAVEALLSAARAVLQAVPGAMLVDFAPRPPELPDLQALAGHLPGVGCVHGNP